MTLDLESKNVEHSHLLEVATLLAQGIDASEVAGSPGHC